MRWNDDLMNAAHDPYCKICKHVFTLGEGATDHFWKEHQILCWEIKSFQDFVDVVMNQFVSNKKIDEESKNERRK